MLRRRDGEADLAMHLDPRKLAILLAVARSGSISEAGRRLGLSQPGISAAIAQLERAVGVPLLERGRSGAVPTRAGALLVGRAEAVEQVLAHAATEIELHGRGAAGLLVVGGTPGALMSLVPAALAQLRRQRLRFKLVVEEAHDRDLVGLLRDMKIDIALSTVGIEAPPADIVEIAIARDVFGVVVAADHPLRGDTVALAELGDVPWVLPAARGAFRRHLDALFLSSDVRIPEDVVLCDSLTTTKEIIRQTHHLTILPRTVVAAEVAGGLLRWLTIRHHPVTRAIGVRRRREPSPTNVSDAFVAAMQASFAISRDSHKTDLCYGED